MRLEFEAYPIAWFAIGMGVGIGACVIGGSRPLWFWGFISICGCTVTWGRSRHFAVQMGLAGVVFGGLRMASHAVLTDFSRPVGIEHATELEGLVINKTEQKVMQDGKVRLVNRYQVEVDSFIDSRGRKISGRKWRVSVRTDFNMALGSYLKAKIRAFRSGEVIFDGGLVRYGNFFRHILANVEIIELIKITLPRQLPLKENTREILLSITKGISPNKNLKEKFAQLGLGHIFAVSGIHISAAFGLFYAFTRCLLIWPHIPLQKISSITGLIGIIIYAAQVNKSMSMIRSTIMILLPLILPVFSRHSRSSTSFLVSLLTILTLWPDAILDPSFQFSFSAVLALIMIKGGIFRSALATFVATTPYTIYHTGFVSILSVPAGILVGGFYTLAVIPIAIVSDFLGKYAAFERAVEVMLRMIDAFPLLPVIKIPLTAASIGVWTANLALVALYRKRFLFVMLSILTFLLQETFPAKGIAISRNRAEVVLIEEDNLYVKEADGIFAAACTEKFCSKNVLEAPFMKASRYKYGRVEIEFNSRGKFLNAYVDGEKILADIDLIKNRKTALIDAESGKVKYI